MKRVLVVEDEKLLRGFLEHLFRRAGHTVVSVGNGQEAWELLDRGEIFDAIISDKDMPKMDGLKLLELVKSDSRTANIRFVLMSGGMTVSQNDQRPLWEVCIKHGATFIQKPLRGAGLVAQLLGEREGDDG